MKIETTARAMNLVGSRPPTRMPPMAEASADTTRYFRLAKVTVAMCSNDASRSVNEWLVKSLDGPGSNVIGEQWDDLSEFPVLGSREVWEFENTRNSMHPMYVHLVGFQIVSKETLDGTPMNLKPWEADTWKDTVWVPAQSRVKVIMDFTDYPGRFPDHCHILDHEDHEMMRQFQTTHDPAYCSHDGVCDPYEDCVSCANDCAQVTGALCGNGLCEAGDGENCVTCPADCAGKQTGAPRKQFCCGAPGGTNNIGCGTEVNDSRCIDTSASLFCREAPRLRACCGDALCEGAEGIAACAVDCDPGYQQDSDGDSIPDPVDSSPNSVDGDGDGLCDGPVAIQGSCLAGKDLNGNGKVDSGETDPNDADSDDDSYNDRMEVLYGSDPLSANDTPQDNRVNNGDVNGIDGVNAVYVLLALQILTNQYMPSQAELVRADMMPDRVINAGDVLRIMQAAMF
jgi:hypothetical protein